jgi:hypothetical protein
MKGSRVIVRLLGVLFLFAFLFTSLCYGQSDSSTPKDHGVYLKTKKTLHRLLPNIVFDQQGVLFVEFNNPPHFLLRDVEHFVIYGSHDMSVLTLNPMVALEKTSLGKMRFMFGKDESIDVKARGKDLYIVKSKGLLGRGYFSLWINDTAWDFVIE